MPVGLPTPRHRTPSSHHTVSSMREMSGVAENPQWMNIPTGVPPPPGAMWPQAIPFQSPATQPPPPPPPQWSMQQWGGGGGAAHPHIPPPPSIPMGGVHPNQAEDHHSDSASASDSFDDFDEFPQEGSQPRHPHSQHNKNMHPQYPTAFPFGVPPPPGFPPYPWAQQGYNPWAMPPPPPPPPPPPAEAEGYEMGVPSEKEGSAERSQSRQREIPLTKRAMRRRREGSEHVATDEDKERLERLYQQITKMRSTSPSRRQIANLQRLQKHMHDDLRESRTASVAEQEAALQALERQAERRQRKAAQRQATHESTVAEIRSEMRQKRHPPSGYSGHAAHTIASKSRTRSLPIKEDKPTAASRTRSSGRIPVSALRSQSPTHKSPIRKKKVQTSTSTSSRAPLHRPANRNADFVQELHNRLTKAAPLVTNISSFDEGDEEEDAVLNYLRKDVLDKPEPVSKLQSSLGTGRPATSRTITPPPTQRRLVNNSARPKKMPAASSVLPTEKDYTEGLEDLHQKLRKTYLELKRHPQRLLSQLTLQGTVTGDNHIQSAAELLSELDNRRNQSSAPPPLPQPISAHQSKPNVNRVRGEMDALEAQWDQLVSNRETSD